MTDLQKLALWDAMCRPEPCVPPPDRLLAALRAAGAAGLTRDEMYRACASRARRAAGLTAWLARLAKDGLARGPVRQSRGRGRPAERWYAAGEGRG